MQNSAFRSRITSLYGSQTSSVVWCFHNGDIKSWINSFYRSKTSSVVLCMQNIVISNRNTNLLGSQTSPVVSWVKKKWLASESLVSMGPSPHRWFLHAKQRLLGQNYKSRPRLRLLICECKTACLCPEWRLSIGPSLHLWFSEIKTATLSPELLVYMGPCPHLWLLHAKQRLYDQKCKSLPVPDLTCHFENSKQRD